jgi:hypothetical protein
MRQAIGLYFDRGVKHGKGGHYRGVHRRAAGSL